MNAKREMVILAGRPLSPGLAIGSAYIHQDIIDQDSAIRDIGEDELESEAQRLERALERASDELDELAQRTEEQLDSDHANVFRAQKTMLSDPALLADLKEELESELINVEHVLQRVFHRWQKRLEGLDKPELRQPADDLRDLNRRVLRALRGIRSHQLENVAEGSIVVAEHLLPSETVLLSRKKTSGVAVVYAGPASHAALIAREMAIPAVSSLSGLLEEVEAGDEMVVDGMDGTVVIRPDEATRQKYLAKRREFEQTFQVAYEQQFEPARTRSGVQVTIMANIGNAEDALVAQKQGADGVGLFRLEQFYLARSALPSVEELEEGIREIIAPFEGLPVTIRLLDIGGDKDLPYLRLPQPSDPFLGMRGVRLLTMFPKLLRSQLRALLNVSRDFDIRILVPMVTFPKEMERMRVKLTEMARKELQPVPPLGAMVETPAAALCCRDLVRHCDFLSIGTNDLTQYTLAVGREDDLVADYFRDDAPAVLRLVRMVVEEAGDTPVSICGELAGRAQAIPILLDMGVRNLSVVPPLVSITKEIVRSA